MLKPISIEDPDHEKLCLEWKIVLMKRDERIENAHGDETAPIFRVRSS